MPERFAEMRASVRERTGLAVAADTLTEARDTLARVNADVRRWNEKADAPFHLEERSEVWLVTTRARRPVR